MELLVLGYLIYELTDSVFQVGLISVFLNGPAPAFIAGRRDAGRPAGPVADSGRYPHLLFACRVGAADALDSGPHSSLVCFPCHTLAGHGQGFGRPSPAGGSFRSGRRSSNRPRHVPGDHHQQYRQDCGPVGRRAVDCLLRLHRRFHSSGDHGPDSGLPDVQDAAAESGVGVGQGQGVLAGNQIGHRLFFLEQIRAGGALHIVGDERHGAARCNTSFRSSPPTY